MAEYYEFDVTLANIEPRIWRRFLISGDAIFADLHEAIQDAMGWEDAHLWVFREPGRDGGTITENSDEDRDDDTTPDAWKVPLANFFNLGNGKDRCVYEYDFGDRWGHAVLLNGEAQDDGNFFRRLIAGERAGPPEDCGGVFGYERIVKFLATGTDPDGEDADTLADWVADWRPHEFDLKEFQEVFNR